RFASMQCGTARRFLQQIIHAIVKPALMDVAASGLSTTIPAISHSGSRSWDIIPNFVPPWARPLETISAKAEAALPSGRNIRKPIAMHSVVGNPPAQAREWPHFSRLLIGVNNVSKRKRPQASANSEFPKNKTAGFFAGGPRRTRTLHVERFGQIVLNHDCGKKDQEDKRRLVDPLFNFLLDITPHDRFDQQHQHQSAVQDRNREQIENGQIQADQGHNFEQRRPAYHGGFAGDLHDPDGATYLLQHLSVVQHAADQLEDQERVLLAIEVGFRKRPEKWQPFNVFAAYANPVLRRYPAAGKKSWSDGERYVLAIAPDNQWSRIILDLLQLVSHVTQVLDQSSIDGDENVAGLYSRVLSRFSWLDKANSFRRIQTDIADAVGT